MPSLTLRPHVCRLLTVDVGYYLPPYKSINVYFMKDLMAKRKKAIKINDVKHLYAPQYDSLSVSKLLDFAAAYSAVEEHLPEPRDIPLLPRQWILNVCFALIGSDFADFVRAQIEQRNMKLADCNNLNVDVDPEILAVIQNSTAVSTQKGTSAHLLKIGSKRRRTQAEIAEFRALRDQPLEALAAKDAALAEKAEELAAQQEALAAQEARIRELQGQLHESKTKLGAAQQAEVVIGQLVEANVIEQEEDGSFRLGS